jgi:hypothetical protein
MRSSAVAGPALRVASCWPICRWSPSNSRRAGRDEAAHRRGPPRSSSGIHLGGQPLSIGRAASDAGLLVVHRLLEAEERLAKRKPGSES